MAFTTCRRSKPPWDEHGYFLANPIPTEQGTARISLELRNDVQVGATCLESEKGKERTAYLVASCFSPRFIVVVKAVVLGDPAVHLDATPLLLPEKPTEERPGHLQRVCLVHHPEESLVMVWHTAKTRRPRTSPEREEQGSECCTPS